MKSWRANWSDTESPEQKSKSLSEDEEDIQRSPKRQRMSPTGLTCEIQGFDISHVQNINKPTVNAETVARDDDLVAKGDNAAIVLTPSAPTRTRISGVYNINDSLDECAMDGSFTDVTHQPVGSREDVCGQPGTCKDKDKEHNVDICASQETPIHHTDGDTHGKNENICGPVGSSHKQCGKNDITGDNQDQSMSTPPSVYYSGSSEVSAVPKPASSTPNIPVASKSAHASPENSHMTISTSSFVTPARNSRELHARQSTSGPNADRVFQTPVGNAPKHFQTTSVSRIKFQSPMEIAYDIPTRSANTTPRRRHNPVSMTSQ